MCVSSAALRSLLVVVALTSAQEMRVVNLSASFQCFGWVLLGTATKGAKVALW